MLTSASYGKLFHKGSDGYRSWSQSCSDRPKSVYPIKGCQSIFGAATVVCTYPVSIVAALMKFSAQTHGTKSWVKNGNLRPYLALPRNSGGDELC